MGSTPNFPALRATPASSPLAFVSDVHGNLPALEAVLAELGRRAVVDLFVAGDLLLGGDEPLAVWRRLQQVGARCVTGPSDLALARVDPKTLRASDEDDARKLRRFEETQRALGDLVRKRLAELPRELRIPMIDGRELLLVHGSPQDPFEPMGHELSDEELSAMLDDEPADIVVCGGTHVPYQRPLGALHVVNVGSVGAAPEGRIAHFTIVSPRMNGAEILQDATPY